MTVIVRSAVRKVALAALMIGAGLASPAALGQQRVGSTPQSIHCYGHSSNAVARQLLLGREVVHGSASPPGSWVKRRSCSSINRRCRRAELGSGDRRVRLHPAAGTGKLAAISPAASSLCRRQAQQTGQRGFGADAVGNHRHRGGVILVKQADGGTLDVIFVYGKGVTVAGLKGVSQTITRPG